MNWMKKIQNAIKEQDTMEDRFFAVVVMVGLAIVSVSVVVTIVEEIGSVANIGTAIGGIMLLIVIYEAYIRGRIDSARIMICYTFNCIVIPIAFFSCGGIDSGMPLYMLAGIFTIIPVLKGRNRIICLIISFLMDIGCIAVSYFMIPKTVGLGAVQSKLLPILSLKARVMDMISSVILIGLYIIITMALVMDAYQKEKAKREVLLAKLDDLSRRDELTGLYNRRELFRFLENMPALDDSYYLCMIDIDHFKELNDTYGHVFGDRVLQTLAGIMEQEIPTNGGELVARYGGEEFMVVVKAGQKTQAVKRIDRIRTRFVDTKWVEDAGLKTAFSGGVVCCADYRNYDEAINHADKLLYKAKQNGRNRLEM